MFILKCSLTLGFLLSRRYRGLFASGSSTQNIALKIQPQILPRLGMFDFGLQLSSNSFIIQVLGKETKPPFI
jgi:hypothetical protein